MDNCIVDVSETILNILSVLNELKYKIVYVTGNRQLVGSVTDGDIRRFAIKYATMNGKAQDCMKTPCIYTKSRHEANKLLKQYQIISIPLVDEKREIIDIIYDYTLNIDELVNEKYREISVVMMAGGRGERLYPLTSVLPKPLIPINGIPIAERILQRFINVGFKNYVMSLNYKKNIIKAYFDDIMKDFRIDYVEEDKPLGTAGSLNLMNDILSDTFISINCDNLIDVDINSLLDHHFQNKNMITVVSSLKQIDIPYGVFKLGEHGEILSLEEKPSIQKFINTGMYVVNKEALKYVKNIECFHMTNLIEMLIEHHEPVGIFAISTESFMDMGVLDELDNMRGKIK